MKCPHCTVEIHEHFWQNGIYRPNNQGGTATQIPFTILAMGCPACRKNILFLQTGKDNRVLVYPEGSNRGPVPADVPAAIAADYNEAARVLPCSPKASAALSRRCLQATLREAGYTQHDLSQQVDAVLKEADSRKALPTGPHSTLDAIRNFGNFSAHPITDKTTLQIVNVEDHEAEYCLDILDSLFDHYYVKPAQAKRIKAELDAKLKGAGKPPSKA